MKSYIRYIRESKDELSPILKISKQQGKSFDQITKLECYNNQLISLEGIENLVNLQYLNFSVREQIELSPVLKFNNWKLMK